MLRSFIPFLLASLGFTLIALTSVMPLFEWQISEIATNLPPEFHINAFWTTKPGESLRSDSYILNQVVMLRDGISCGPIQLTYVVDRSQSDEELEQIALDVYQGVTRWLTGFDFTGQITMAVILFLCGINIWWFTIWHNRPIAEAFISTILAVILLVVLINVWRILGPMIGAFACLPEIHGRLSFDAKLLKVHYETLVVLFLGICAELGALGIILHQIMKSINQGKDAAKSAVG